MFLALGLDKDDFDKLDYDLFNIYSEYCVINECIYFSTTALKICKICGNSIFEYFAYAKVNNAYADESAIHPYSQIFLIKIGKMESTFY